MSNLTKGQEAKRILVITIGACNQDDELFQMLLLLESHPYLLQTQMKLESASLLTHGRDAKAENDKVATKMASDHIVL